MKEKMHSVSVRLPEETYARLLDFAAESHIAPAVLCRTFVKIMLDQDLETRDLLSFPRSDLQGRHIDDHGNPHVKRILRQRTETPDPRQATVDEALHSDDPAPKRSKYSGPSKNAKRKKR